MNGGTLALIMGGLIAFGAGAYLAATGERTTGIASMGLGLTLQVLALVRLKQAKKEGSSDAG